MEISGQKIRLVEFCQEHLTNQKYFSWLRDINVINTIGRSDYLLNLTFGEVENYINTLFLSKTNCLFAIHTIDDNFIGTLKIGHIDWRTGTADMGIMIGDKAFWGKGIATESLFLASKYAFDKLCLRKLTSGCASQNTAMVRAFEKLGYVQEGCLRKKFLISGAYDDHVLFGLFKDELREISY